MIFVDTAIYHIKLVLDNITRVSNFEKALEAAIRDVAGVNEEEEVVVTANGILFCNKPHFARAAIYVDGRSYNSVQQRQMVGKVRTALEDQLHKGAVIHVSRVPSAG